ncbi:MAG: 4Fe-4S dicluster domain-containing protein, partial [Desulfurococcus sp.]
VCNYDAVHVEESSGKRVARVNIMKCYGCGLCTSVCPTRAIHFIEK